MFRFDLESVNLKTDKGKLGLKSGLLMQFVNGKEWAFVIMIMSQFIGPFGGGIGGHYDNNFYNIRHLYTSNGCLDFFWK